MLSIFVRIYLLLMGFGNRFPILLITLVYREPKYPIIGKTVQILQTRLVLEWVAFDPKRSICWSVNIFWPNWLNFENTVCKGLDCQDCRDKSGIVQNCFLSESGQSKDTKFQNFLAVRYGPSVQNVLNLVLN